MFIEKLLTHYMRILSARHLSFPKNNSWSIPKPQDGKSYLLYIHVPFCEELCPYCSFYRVRFESALAFSYFESLKKEMELYRKNGFSFESIYVGGGTPTVLTDKLAEVLKLAQAIWPIKKISVETNPNHLIPQIIRTLLDAGVNRLSVGVQTFNDRLLTGIDRIQKYGSGREIKQKLADINGAFDTLNIDLIFNFPNQTLAMLLDDIKIVKDIKADQVTFYPLMVSRSNKKLLQARYGKISYLQERRFYKRITGELSNLYRQASAWCFSRKDGMIDEYILDHDEYAGLGAGSFGYINGNIYSNTFSVENYIELVQRGLLPVAARKSFFKQERVRYEILMKLFGGTLNLDDLSKKYRRLFRFHFWKKIFIATGAATCRNDQLLLTLKGQYYLVILMREFFSGVNNLREIRTSGDNRS